MAKYLIHIENIGEGPDWNSGDLECDGFVILANLGNHESFEAIHQVDDLDIAQMLAEAEDLHTGMIIGRAMIEAAERKKDREASGFMAAMVRGLRGDD